MSAEETSADGGFTVPLLARDARLVATGATQRKTVNLGSVERPVLTLTREWLGPLVVTASLCVCMLAFGEQPSAKHAALGLLAFLLSHHAFRSSDWRIGRGNGPAPRSRPWGLLIDWAFVPVLLSMLGMLLGLTHLFPPQMILCWFALTPVALLLADRFAERFARQARFATRRHVIIGANDIGAELARRIQQGDCLGKFMGFFDFRSPDRLAESVRQHFVGNCDGLAAFVRRHGIDAIYMALPISNAPRIEELLRELRDTTASIYFVPNVLAFDLIQSHCVEINGMAVVSICDTPFHGMNAIRKRAMDLVFALSALLVTWPLILLITLAVKLSSPGPVLFRQRRYGLNGEEIVIYKYRTMTVCEDGASIAQAVRNDHRITPIGRLLRRTSLDELPQIFNVLEGKMSFVGPRPHAVAHNEQYRQLISGYMIRHKIRPGITGWAQVNGLRGETDTVEKMRHRVDYDIDYLKHWSLWLDLKIVARTVLMVFDDPNAY